MSDQLTQIIRSMTQAVWAALVSVSFLADLFAEIGIDEDAAMGAAFALAMGVIVIAGRELPKLHPIFGVIINLINKPPAYQPPEVSA